MPRKMKESGVEWLGQIPERWDCLPARCVFREVKDKNVSGEETRQLSFRYGEIVDKRGNDATKEAEEETITAYRIVTPNTIMVNGLNLNYDFVTQRVAIVRKRGIITSAYLAVSANEQMLKTAFALYLLKGYDSKQVFHGHGSGIRKTLKFEDFKDIKISLPPLPEQERIAAFLDERCAKIDGMIAEAKASIEDYKKWKQSIIFEAVTGKHEKNLKPSGVDWIGDVPEGWRVVRLKHVLKSPLQYGASESGVAFQEDLPRYIRITDITLDGRLKDDAKLSLTEEMTAGYILRNFDILLARSGATVGKAFLYKQEYGRSGFAGYLIRASIDEAKMDPCFVYFTMLGAGYEQWKDSVAVQATIQNIGADKYNNYSMIQPPLPEQRRIAAELDEKCAAIDKLVGEKESLIADLEAYKKSLIFETVTGKREIA